jgi:hypothetical protein
VEQGRRPERGLTGDEAQALLDLLEDELDADLVDELKEIAEGSEEQDDTSWDDDELGTVSSTTKKKEKEKATESESEENFSTSFLFFEKKKKAATGAVDKKRLGAWVVRVMKDLGLTIVLAGGGAVTVLGSAREIKDLDFRIELPGT